MGPAMQCGAMRSWQRLFTTVGAGTAAILLAETMQAPTGTKL
jgi:hypothetical protein